MEEHWLLSPARRLTPVIGELTRKTQPLLEHERSTEFTRNRLYGTKFTPEKAAAPDFASPKRIPIHLT